MNRVAAILSASALVVAGVFLYERATGCSASFQIRYTSPLAAIMAMPGDADAARRCDLLAEELLDADIATTALGLSIAELQDRLSTHALPDDGMHTNCRIAYRGRNEAEALSGLNALASILVQRAAENALAQRAKTIQFIREYLAEITHRRKLANSSDETTPDRNPNWTIAENVEGWSTERFESVVDRLQTVLATEHDKPVQMSCIDYLDRVNEYPPESLRALDRLCRESKPIGVMEWPTRQRALGRGDGCASRAPVDPLLD